MKGDNEMAALVAAVDGDASLELELGDVLGRFRRRRDAAIRDQEAAALLPLGACVAAERQRVHRATVYRRVSRFQKVARQIPDATKS